MMRIDKYLSNSLGISRKQVKKAITSKKVIVDSETVKSANLKISPQQSVLFEGKQVIYEKNQYYLLNKPEGYICSTQDEQYPSALTILPTEIALNSSKSPLHFAGRLDVDTTGLVLISNDGQWTHRVTSPRYEKSKRYHVTLAEPICDKDVERLCEGILLKGESKPTLPATVERVADEQVYLTIKEGRYHQVKRMIGAINNRVVQLHRAAIGELVMESSMQPGDFRPLTEHEVSLF
jgi:16S rRNA pseudouridine516 synthase